MEQNEDVTVYNKEHGAQKLCMVALISYVGSESTIHGIYIDLNVTLDIDVVGDDGYNSSDPCDQDVDSDSDVDVDDIPDDIDDEDVNDDEDINAPSVGNQMRRIVIHNNLGPHMSLIDPDNGIATHLHRSKLSDPLMMIPKRYHYPFPIDKLHQPKESINMKRISMRFILLSTHLKDLINGGERKVYSKTSPLTPNNRLDVDRKS
ncbi:hypothetical protein J1N35_014133 [Gossypium stocksii]|uniref:Uncharacterized protein n=1 Tax=Gossypium stocksii TaxID=47602 RepID=A0A9D3VUD2_9ROSI|nr:hypothetical protein J1N35_014133 [Gossypium stocksii]